MATVWKTVMSKPAKATSCPGELKVVIGSVSPNRLTTLRAPAPGSVWM